MYLYLIRHGLTDWNTIPLVQGSTDIPLNDTGREMARKASLKLADIPFQLVLSSPLSRARETAAIASAGRGLTVREIPELREMDFGFFEGKSSREYPEIREIFNAPEHYIPRGGESFEALDLRCRAFLKKAARLEGTADYVLACSHGAAIRGVLRAVQNTPIKNFWDDPYQPNCGLNLLECKNGTWKVLKAGVDLLNLPPLDSAGNERTF